MQFRQLDRKNACVSLRCYIFEQWEKSFLHPLWSDAEKSLRHPVREGQEGRSCKSKRLAPSSLSDSPLCISAPPNCVSRRTAPCRVSGRAAPRLAPSSSSNSQFSHQRRAKMEEKLEKLEYGENANAIAADRAAHNMATALQEQEDSGRILQVDPVNQVCPCARHACETCVLVLLNDLAAVKSKNWRPRDTHVWSGVGDVRQLFTPSKHWPSRPITSKRKAGTQFAANKFLLRASVPPNRVSGRTAPSIMNARPPMCSIHVNEKRVTRVRVQTPHLQHRDLKELVH